MEISKIQTFLTVANVKSFHEAADILYLTASTVSKHIASLEDELECTLFIRTVKGVELSEDGKRIYPYAERMARNYRGLIEQVHPTAPSQMTKVCTIAPYAIVGIPELLKLFYEAYPDEQIVLLDEPGVKIPELILSGDYPLGICADIHFNAACMDCIALQERPYYLFVNVKHPMAGRESVSLKELRDEKFIDLPELTGVPAFKRKLFENIDIEYKPNIITEREENLIAMVAANAGVAILDCAPGKEEPIEQYGKNRVIAIPLAEECMAKILLVKSKTVVLEGGASKLWNFTKATIKRRAWPVEND